jgi:hypothetical protein
MIRTALEFIQKELDAYMADREQDPDYSITNIVKIQSIVNPNGVFNTPVGTSHITLMLAGLEEEKREGKRPYFRPTDDKQFLRLQPPVELDLFLLFVAYKTDYPTALRDLSDVISFFQANPVFDEQKYPALNAAVSEPDKKPWQLIERLSFFLYNMSFEQMNNLWAMLGSKYMPSIVYKMKMLTVFETKAKEKAPAIIEMNIDD